MKQVKVKKIKKIPKYSEGGLAELSDKSGLAPGKIIQPDVVTKKIGQDASNVFNKNFGGGVGTQSMPSFSGISALNTGMGVAAAASQPIASALGIEQGKAGQLVGGVGKAVGLINPVAGLAIEAVAPFLGGTGHVNYDQITTTSNTKKAVQERSGILGGLFGKDSDQLYVDANQYQNSLVAAELSANAQTDWVNDPRNQYAVDTLKEGGKVGMTPVYLDSKEVVTDENGNNAVRMPYAEGTDSILALAKHGSKVFSKRRGYADIAEKIIKGTEEGSRLREIETNKLAMIQEATKINKPSKKGIVHAVDGDDDLFGIRALGDKVNRWGEQFWRRLTADKYGFAGNNYVPDRIRGTIPQQYQYSTPTGIAYGEVGGETWGTVMTPSKTIKTEKTNVIPIKTVTPNYTLTDKDLNLFDKHPWMTAPVETLNTQSVKKSSNSTKRVSTGTVKSRTSTSTPSVVSPTKLSTEILDKTTPGTAPTFGLNTSLSPRQMSMVRPVVENKTDNTKSTTNWEDLAYKAASILTPLFDREKAETTRLQRPTWHGIPVAIDVLNQLQDAQLGYALANYNTAQGGYTAGQQLAARGAAASDLARKRVAIHQWQTEQQNKNIAQNIASYNAHANMLAEIANKESDINAANRASARNINRQGRATALKNWGQIRRNEKQYAMDDVRMAALEPLLQYAYENPEQIKKLVNKAKG